MRCGLLLQYIWLLPCKTVDSLRLIPPNCNLKLEGLLCCLQVSQGNSGDRLCRGIGQDDGDSERMASGNSEAQRTVWQAACQSAQVKGWDQWRSKWKRCTKARLQRSMWKSGKCAKTYKMKGRDFELKHTKTHWLRGRKHWQVRWYMYDQRWLVKKPIRKWMTMMTTMTYWRHPQGPVSTITQAQRVPEYTARGGREGRWYDSHWQCRTYGRCQCVSGWCEIMC